MRIKSKRSQCAPANFKNRPARVFGKGVSLLCLNRGTPSGRKRNFAFIRRYLRQRDFLKRKKSWL